MNFYQMHPPQFVVFVLVIEASSDFTRSDRMSMQALPSNHRVNSSNGFKVLFSLSLSLYFLPLPPSSPWSQYLSWFEHSLPSFSPSPFANDTEVLFRVFYILTSLSPPLVFLLVRKTIENKGAMKRKRFCVLFVFQLLRCISCFNTLRYYRYQDINWEGLCIQSCMFPCADKRCKLFGLEQDLTSTRNFSTRLNCCNSKEGKLFPAEVYIGTCRVGNFTYLKSIIGTKYCFDSR